MLPVTETDDLFGSSYKDNTKNLNSDLCSEATFVVPLNQTRRNLFQIPHKQQPTTFEQTRLEEDVANEMTLEKQDADVWREAEAGVGGALNPRDTVEFLLEELLLNVVGKRIGDNASNDDFFSQESQPQQHLAPCSQDFAFFKAIELTRDDLTTEEDESQEDELSLPSQLVHSPSTSELDHLLGLARPSQEEFFSSPEGAPALKRRRTLTSQEVEDIRIKTVGEDDDVDEVTEGNRSTDGEGDALPLTFHTKEDLIRKLQGIHYIPRGKPSF